MINPALFGYGGYSIGAASHAGEASRAQSAARNAERDAALTDDRLERLALVCMAMWSLIQDKTNLTEQDLLDRVKTLDLMDGVEDGKATQTVAKCRKCERVMAPRHKRCLYCGADRLVQSAFDSV